MDESVPTYMVHENIFCPVPFLVNVIAESMVSGITCVGFDLALNFSFAEPPKGTIVFGNGQ